MMGVEINDPSGLVALVAVIVGAFAVTFVLIITRARGKDLEITHQVKGIKAESAEKAMKIAYNTLSEEQKNQVKKVYMKRDDSEGE